MSGGKPRTVSLSPDEMVKLGEEMIQWVQENQPVHLSQFYTIHKGYTEKEWNTMRQAPEFLQHYEKALKMIGIQYLLKDSNISDSIKHRWQRIYFGDLRQEEDDTKRSDAEIKKMAEDRLQDLLVKVIDYSLAQDKKD